MIPSRIASLAILHLLLNRSRLSVNVQCETLRQSRSRQQHKQDEDERKKGDDRTDCKHTDLLQLIEQAQQYPIER